MELELFRIAIKRNQPPQKPYFDIVYKGDGPLWFRDLAQKDEEIFKEDVDRILSNLGANYMVIAHTPQKATIQSKFEGRVWSIDTGISDYYGGKPSALIIEKGKFSVWGE